MPDLWFFEALPYRPAPYPDECLSGYLLRLADANGFAQLWDLAAELFPRWSYLKQTPRLRWEHPVEDWHRLTERTHLTVSDLRRLTVAPWVEKFRSPLDQARSQYWSPGNALRGVARPNLQVCPLCLQATPYLRLIWRLAGVSACLEHGCLLQTHCRSCGRPLSVADPAQQHLRCAGCQAELHTLPMVPAPPTVLAAQLKAQIGLRFLLDTERRLVPALPPGSPELPAAIGLKFRYLRVQEKRSVTVMARQLGVEEGRLTDLERGPGARLALYPIYLEHFKLSWPEFAGLAVPPEFVAELSQPRHLALRVCPTEGCPNHVPPPGLGVLLEADLPERRSARFHCRACERHFTRSYDGQQVIKPRKPVLQPGPAHSPAKTAQEIACLKTMGLRGEPNLQIARKLGWIPKTIDRYWITLGLKDRVHQAQTRWRARDQRQRDAARRAQVEAVLRTMREQDEMISLCEVARAVGHGPNYLGSYPDLAQRVKAAAEPHNARVRQRRYAAVRACLSEAIARMERSTTLVKVEALVRPTGLTYAQLKASFPDLYAMARQAARSHREALRGRRRHARQAAINAAAARLVASGSRLTFGTILKEATLSRYTSQCDPALRELLHQWVGGFAPHD